MSDLERAMNSGATSAPVQAPARKRAGTKKAAKKAKAPKRAKKAAKAPKAKQARRGRADISLDLGSAIGLMGSMHRTDLETFQTITAALGDKGVKSRNRILAALTQVYAK